MPVRVDAIIAAHDAGRTASTTQQRDLTKARNAFEEVRPHGGRDAEAACTIDPGLAHEAGSTPRFN
jgi:hypothetical protein